LHAQAGHLAVLINNAGIVGEVAAPENMTVDQVR
jgi:NAD(P)-dependent dehydrogenase (short-subunit alcohol dehydrogenase family)